MKEYEEKEVCEYEITYSEGLTINKKTIVKGKTMLGALVKFLEEHPNADYQKVDLVRKDSE